MIGEAVAIGMEDTHTPLINAIAITFALGILQWLLTWVNLRFRWLEKITQGTSAPIVVNGKIDHKVLRAERVSKADLYMELRQKDVKLKDIKEARLEPTGKVSVIQKTSTKSSDQSSSQEDDSSSSDED